MPRHQFPSRLAHQGTQAEKAAWEAIDGLLEHIDATQITGAVKRATALALALLEGGEQATEEEMRAAAGKRDEPLQAAHARAVRDRTDRLLAARFGGTEHSSSVEPEVPGFGLITSGDDVTAVVFSEGDALRLSRATGHRIGRVLVRKAPPAPAASEAGAAAQRDFAGELRAMSPGQSLTLPLPAVPTNRRFRQIQVATLAKRLWGKGSVRTKTHGDCLVLTRLQKPIPEAASVPGLAA